MVKSKNIKLYIVLFALGGFSLADAHKPRFTEGRGKSPDQAIWVKNVKISQVYYHQVTPETSQVWLNFNADKGQKLFVQLGVPVLDRLRCYRPAVAIVGPCLPESKLPFPVPEKMGAMEFRTENVTEPRFFHEPFTDTDSWILLEKTVTLPSKGNYYLVAYVPSGQPGKLWVAVGKREAFGLGDWLKFNETKKRVRAFHEKE